MKSFLLNTLLLLLVGINLPAQTIVSTSPQNKKAILEYFGGMYCDYCPEADSAAAAIKAAHPSDVFLINIQTGFFASPQVGDIDLRTEWGQALELLSGNTQWYPAGTVNREVFPNYELGDSGTSALGREWWSYAVNQVLDQPSPVNIALEATFNLESNTIEIYLEYYYTSDCEAPTNHLNVALVQNEVIGTQLYEGGIYNDSYSHNYLLRDLLTGQWGEEIPITTEGGFGVRTFSYALPSNFREVLVNPAKLEITAFISTGQEAIQTAISSEVVIPTATTKNDVNLWNATGILDICDNYIQPVATIRNDGTTPITTLDLEYNINGGTSNSFEWNGNLEFLETKLITLPGFFFDANPFGDYSLQMYAQNPNGSIDETDSNNELNTNLDQIPATAQNVVTLELRTDNYGYEIYWEVVDAEENLIISGGNYNVGANGGGHQTATPNDPGAYGSHSIFIETIELPGFGCYEFRILDDFSDGICCDYGAGYYRVKNQSGEILFSGGKFDTEKIDPFLVAPAVTSTVAVQQENIVVYPNPVTEDYVNLSIHFNEANLVDLSVHDAAGKVVHLINQQPVLAGKQEIKINTSPFPNGIYFIRMKVGTEIISKKIVVLR